MVILGNNSPNSYLIIYFINSLPLPPVFNAWMTWEEVTHRCQANTFYNNLTTYELLKL